MAASISPHYSVTSDELAHLTAGHAYWQTHDYRLHPENGFFPQRWMTLLFQLQSPPPALPPTLDNPHWQQAAIWEFGDAFFHRSHHDPASLLASARTMIAHLSAALCGAIFLQTRLLFGLRAAWLALLLATFCPALLAHGGLATSDTAGALGFTVALLAWASFLRRLSPLTFLAAVFSLGLLALSKFSVVLFPPMVAVLVLLRLVRRAPLRLHLGPWRTRLHGSTKFAALLLACSLAAAGSVALIWAAHGFRFAAFPPDAPQAAQLHFNQSWDTVLLAAPPPPPMTMADGRTLPPLNHAPGLVQAFVLTARDWHLLPESYLYGLAFVEKHARGRLAFFAGDYRMTGWRTFFPTLFALKTPLPALALFALAAYAWLTLAPRRRRAFLHRAAPLLVYLLVYGAFSIQSRLNIGHRHLLPVYASAYVLAGAVAFLPRRHPAWWLALVPLLGWHVRDSLAARPDYLPYFNQLVSDHRAASWWAVDSSLDWGQDLPRLAAWLPTRPANQPVFLSYFGSGSPSHAGIHATRFGDGYFDWEPRSLPSLTGGTYVISATMFRRVYTHVRGPWSPAYEARYQELQTWVNHLRSYPSANLPTELDGSVLSPETAQARLFTYEQLQFGRLLHALQNRPVDHHVAPSLFVFELTDNEVRFALDAPLDALQRALNP